MDEMQNRRGEYVKGVKAQVEDDLVRNGLELEAVSLTSLDQVSIELFNPSNAFDAEGLTQLTEQIESRKKARNDIEQDTAITGPLPAEGEGPITSVTVSMDYLRDVVAPRLDAAAQTKS